MTQLVRLQMQTAPGEFRTIAQGPEDYIQRYAASLRAPAHEERLSREIGHLLAKAEIDLPMDALVEQENKIQALRAFRDYCELAIFRTVPLWTSGPDKWTEGSSC